MMTENATKNCIFCGQKIAETAKKCKHCGKWLDEQEKVCPYCLEKIPLSAKKCSHCGSVVQRKKSELVKTFVLITNILIVIIGVLLEILGGGNCAGILSAVVLAILASLYLLPSLIADHKMHKYTNFIFLLNLLLGWTFFAWIGALIWAFISDD